MNKFLVFVIALMLTMFTSVTFAWTPPSAPADGGYVVDLTGKLSSAHKDLLNHKIEQMNRDTANEYGILLVPNMNGATIEDVADSTYRAWGIGKKGLDNGCLIVVAIAERKSRIETGKGVGGDVPDLKANHILKSNLNPHLRNGDFYGGFDETLTALNSQIVSHRAEASKVVVEDTVPTPQATGGCAIAEFGVSLAVILGGMILFLMLRSRNNSKREVLRAMAVESARLRNEQHALATKVAEAAERQRRKDQAAAQKTKARASQAKTSLSDTQRSIKYDTPPSSRPDVSRVVTIATSVSSVADQLRKQRAADQAREASARRDREARESEERKRHQQEEQREEQRRAERRRAREREEEESRRSSSGFDWGGGSSGGGFGGFGGGSSGGGGSSSDW